MTSRSLLCVWGTVMLGQVQVFHVKRNQSSLDSQFIISVPGQALVFFDVTQWTIKRSLMKCSVLLTARPVCTLPRIPPFISSCSFCNLVGQNHTKLDYLKTIMVLINTSARSWPSNIIRGACIKVWFCYQLNSRDIKSSIRLKSITTFTIQYNLVPFTFVSF